MGWFAPAQAGKGRKEVLQWLLQAIEVGEAPPELLEESQGVSAMLP